MMKLQFYNDNGKAALVIVQSFPILEYIMFIHIQFLYYSTIYSLNNPSMINNSYNQKNRFT